MPRLCFALTLAAAVLVPGASPAQDRRFAIGTLACAAEDITTPPPAVMRALQCRFVPVRAHPVVNFAGTIQKFAGEGIPPGRKVMIWSVLAPSPETPADALQGRYVSVLVETLPNHGYLLMGGANGEIALQPVTAAAQSWNAGPETVLDLVLAPIGT
jgi:hypothetical protein